jgi:hypothetical protein
VHDQRFALPGQIRRHAAAHVAQANEANHGDTSNTNRSIDRAIIDLLMEYAFASPGLFGSSTRKTDRRASEGSSNRSMDR